MVTHDPRVLSFGDRIIHLEDGRIVKEEKNLVATIVPSSFLEALPTTQQISQVLSI
jgi:ABC-type uncharacterized transport system ATPase component